MVKKAREKPLEKSLRQEVVRMGGKCLKYYNPWEAGYPDRVIFFPGPCAFLAETKSQGKTPRKLQGVRIKQLRKMGFTVFVINTRESLKAALMEMKEKISQYADLF